MVQSAGFVTVDKVVVSLGINITVCFIDSGYIGFFLSTVDFIIILDIVGNLRGICIALEYCA